jgi:hypothetical protein
MGKVKEFLWTEPDQELDQEPEDDENQSHVDQIKALKKIIDNLLTLKETWVYQVEAWQEIYCAASTILAKEEYSTCIHGTVGCITRHKNYDTCTDDPTYVHGVNK